MTNKYLEKIALNRGAKEMLKHLAKPGNKWTAKAAEKGLRSDTPENAKRAANVLGKDVGNNRGPGVDVLNANYHWPLKKRILERARSDAFEKPKPYLAPRKFPWE